MRFLKRIATGFRNLWAWLPIIWNDRQWDYFFFYRLLAKKFSLMLDYYGSEDRRFLRAPVTAAYIRVCHGCADRLVKDEYLGIELDRLNHRERWGRGRFVCNPIGDGLSEWRGIWHEKAENYEQNDQANEEFRLASERADIRRECDRRVLFEIMAKRFEYWWD